jgi:hypothetical protein
MCSFVNMITKSLQVILLLFVLLSVGCDQIAPTSYTKEEIPCAKGMMGSAFNEYRSKDQPIPNIMGLKSDFVILVDPNLKTTDFISWTEDYLRNESINLDTTGYSSWKEGWENTTESEKVELVKKEKALNRQLADSIHDANQGKQEVWLINNSNKVVDIQLQDWSFIAVLEALTKKREWKPVQYWRFSNCGNSYQNKHFAPKTANSFIARGINSGDYKTKLRYKLLGRDKFYYSNEFDGSINYCEFGEDTSKHTPYYKLETFERLAMEDLHFSK